MQQRNRKLERGYKLKNTLVWEAKKYQTDCLENQRRKSEDLKLRLIQNRKKLKTGKAIWKLGMGGQVSGIAMGGFVKGMGG